MNRIYRTRVYFDGIFWRVSVYQCGIEYKKRCLHLTRAEARAAAARAKYNGPF